MMIEPGSIGDWAVFAGLLGALGALAVGGLSGPEAEPEEPAKIGSSYRLETPWRHPGDPRESRGRQDAAAP